MKKAQTEQIFIYIFALVVIAAILIVGLKSIGGIKKTSEQVELANALENLDTKIEEVFNYGVGTVKKEGINFPISTQFICFVQENPDFSKIDDNKIRQVIQGRISSGATENLYWQLEGKNIEGKTLKNIKVKDGILFLKPVNGKIIIKLENKGDYVEIS